MVINGQNVNFAVSVGITDALREALEYLDSVCEAVRGETWSIVGGDEFYPWHAILLGDRTDHLKWVASIECWTDATDDEG